MEAKDAKQAIERARQAKELLEHPLLVEAFDGLEAGLVKRMVDTGPDQVPARENAHRAIHTLRNIKKVLQSVIETGRITEHEMEQAASRR